MAGSLEYVPTSERRRKAFDRPRRHCAGATTWACTPSPVSAHRAGTTVASGPGTYVVLREPTSDPAFAVVSQGGWFKGRNPAVGVDQPGAKWVPRAKVVYIGQGGDLPATDQPAVPLRPRKPRRSLGGLPLAAR